MYKKVYLSRAQTKAMSAEYPIGDPTGGPAYGERNDPVTATIVGGTALVGGYMQSQAAGKAADQYSRTAQQGIDYNKQLYGDVLAQNQPYMDLGKKGTNLYGQLADSGYLTNQPSMDDLTRLMPNYQFGLQQGMGQFNAQQNAAGGLIGGNAIQGAQQFAQGYAGNALTDAFNQYQANRTNVVSNVNALTGVGQNANQTVANMAGGTSGNVSNMLSSIGNAQAAGTMGQANAYANSLNSVSNYAMLYGMMNKGGGKPGQ
jgi:hypothetical protein